MANVSYQPWYQTAAYPTWDFPVMTDSGPDDLTGVDITKFSMIFRNLNGVDTPGTGTFSLKVLYPAEILYKPSVADVAAAFNGTIVVEALYPPSNSTADKVAFDPIAFTITAV